MLTKRCFTFLFMFWISFSANADLNPNNEVIKLKTMPVVKMQPMQEFLVSKKINAEFDNEVFLVTLKDGTHGVFKSVPNDDLGDAEAKGSDFLTTEYFKAILNRRDQVLLAYKQHKKEGI